VQHLCFLAMSPNFISETVKAEELMTRSSECNSIEKHQEQMDLIENSSPVAVSFKHSRIWVLRNTSWQALPSPPPCRRASACWTPAGIVVTGGSLIDVVDDPTPGRLAFLYKADTKEWEKLPPMIAPRSSHSSAFLNGSDGGRWANGSISTVEKYNIETQEWSRLADLPVETKKPYVAVVNGRLFVMGGYVGSDDDAVYLQENFVYNEEMNEWESREAMPEKCMGVQVLCWALTFTSFVVDRRGIGVC
jgi:hypothetical protein